jgi:hypothetical protein
VGGKPVAGLTDSGPSVGPEKARRHFAEGDSNKEKLESKGRFQQYEVRQRMKEKYDSKGN